MASSSVTSDLTSLPVANRAPGAPGRLPDVLALELSAIIERRIVYLDIHPGTHITELEVCDEFKVSRSPVREAFRELEASGLVVRLARRGVRVTPMTEEDLEAIYYCRIPLEGMAAARAATNASADDVAFLGQRLADMTRALKAKDPKTFFDNNVAFINRIHSSTGNPVLARILNIIEKQALRYRYFAHVRTPRMLANSHRGLNEIFAAVSAGESARAKRAAVEVMREAKAIIGTALREHPV